ncbi:MAG: 16S rRNA (uracil(1498)-N(3))-methyltransferase [Eubacterium sp.]|nr:16S rRNA (uracil(1498)-N(3))-methyltransferase [Eubacterium sp.]
MHRFFVSDISSSDKFVEITGPDVNHIANVLRLSVGDEITVSDGSSRDYLCSISSIDAKNEQKVTADIIDIYDSNAELPAEIMLYQGFPKGDKFETIIQKCVELGVHEIIPVMMERTIVKLDDKKQQKKLERYNGISASAAKQSRRGIIPEVSSFVSMKEAVLKASTDSDVIILPYESAEGMQYSRNVFNEVAEGVKKGEIKRISVFIGPEGGFADSEVKSLEEAGAKIISLGHRILRTETAGMTVMSILSFLLDE